MVRARKYREEHEIDSFPVKLLITLLQFLHSCIKNIWYCFQWRFILQDLCDSFCYKYNFLDYGRVVFVKGHPFSCVWDVRCSLKATLGTMFSASFTIPVHLAATPDPPTQWQGCSGLWWMRGQAQPPQLGLSYKGLWIALALVVSQWSPVLLPVTGVVWDWGQARHWQQWEVVSVGSGHFLALLNLGEGKTSCHWAVQRDSVLLITCIKKYMKINWSIVYNCPQLWFLGSAVATCWLVPSAALAAKEDLIPSLF